MVNSNYLLSKPLLSDSRYLGDKGIPILLPVVNKISVIGRLEKKVLCQQCNNCVNQYGLLHMYVFLVIVNGHETKLRKFRFNWVSKKIRLLRTFIVKETIVFPAHIFLSLFKDLYKSAQLQEDSKVLYYLKWSRVSDQRMMVQEGVNHRESQIFGEI